MSDSQPTHTYQTRVPMGLDVAPVFDAYASLMSRVQRHLFAQAAAGANILSLKNSFLARFGITARQFNGVRVQLQGKMESIKQLNSLHIQSLKERVKKLSDSLASPKRRRDDRRKLHGKRLRLRRLSSKLARLEKDRSEGRVRLCFGSRKLFRKQFDGEQSHAEWKQQWTTQRSHEFFALGSKDETAGNQTCTATVAEDGSFHLRLRLPDALGMGKYMEIPGLYFAYGHSQIVAALQSCLLRAQLQKEGNPDYKNHGQAISYRFVRDSKGWRIFVSTQLKEPEWLTDRRLGAIGVDINVDHLAIVETDRNGNPLRQESIPLNLYGKSQDQAKALIGDACAYVVRLSEQTRKPLVVERLDFTKKRQTLNELQASSARLLSSFAYGSILQSLRSRAYRSAVQVFDVNPAFTSLMGRVKYASQYGLSVHHAAALCIARRFYGFSEKLPYRSSVPDGKGNQISFFVPVRNRRKNEWSHFREVSRKLRAALAEHFRVARSQSSDPPQVGLCDEQSSRIVGAIPACEPLAQLLG